MVPWSASKPIQAYTRNKNDVQNGKIIANNNSCLVTVLILQLHKQ